MTAAVTPHDFSEIRWRGHWIWVPEEPIAPSGFLGAAIDPHAPEAHGLFRKTFRLGEVPERAPARITADSRYALFVNGREASRGPIRSQPRRMHYDLLDLAPFLREGENVLAVYVKYYGTPKSFWMPAAPNLTLGKAGVLVFEADLGAAGWLVSDASWRARKSDAWDSSWREEVGNILHEGVPVEVVDARRLPHDWWEAGFDDSSWRAAQTVPATHIGGFARTQPPTDPYGPLFPRPISPLGGATEAPASIQVDTLDGAVDAAIGSPVRRVEAAVGLPVAATARPGGLPVRVELAAGQTARVVLDMGRIVSGLAQFAVEAPAGAVLDLSYSETPVRGPAGMIAQHAGTRYVARGAHDAFEVFDTNGLRYAYILIHGAEGPVTLTRFAVRELLYPWQEGAGFRCDDDELNRIYAAGVRTVELNSHDAFIDCPTREQRAWAGDGVVHQMVHLATNTDWRLAWHYLTLGNSPRSDGILPMSVVGDIELGGGFTIPDWALHWVHGVYNRYRFSGDAEAVKALMPSVERVLRWYAPFQTSGGVLKDLVEWNLVDWASISTADTSAVITALWARGLREFAEMAGWLEERASQRWAAQLYERVRAGFDVFWDERRGAYVDHIVDGERRPEVSQLAGALAIVAGLAPQERHARIIDYITDPGRLVVSSWARGGGADDAGERMRRQMQGIYEPDWDVEREVVLAQPFMSYTVHDAVAQAGMADRLADLYPRWSQFLEGGYDTIGECWGWGTHVHGWSSTPTRDMAFYTLGVTPAEPGFAAVRVAPRLGRLQWAQGSVPTPHGLVHVRASREGVAVESPVPVVLDLPGQAVRRLEAGRHEVRVA